MSIEISNVSKTFGALPVLNDVSLKIEPGEMVALLGPSGCGKTTLLRIIAGLEMPDAGSGSIRFNGQDVTHQSVCDRHVGFVFQHYALFRHMTIFENVAFGLRVLTRRMRPPESEIRQRVDELLAMVQLGPFAGRYPGQLSGGQRQRVALARALAVEPTVLLLDEPFGALDAKIRRELRHWLRKLQNQTGITSLLVTHDQEEALEVADRVAVMNRGSIQQIGQPNEVYESPANSFVLNFLGSVNQFGARVQQGHIRIGADDFGTARPPGKAAFAQFDAPGRTAADRPGFAYARPHEIEVSREHHGRPHLKADVQHVNAAGPVARLFLRRKDTGDFIEAELPREKFKALTPRRGEELCVSFKNLRVFDDDRPALPKGSHGDY
jgi:sulfate transport system ATP-binding protein